MARDIVGLGAAVPAFSLSFSRFFLFLFLFLFRQE